MIGKCNCLQLANKSIFKFFALLHYLYVQYYFCFQTALSIFFQEAAIPSCHPQANHFGQVSMLEQHPFTFRCGNKFDTRDPIFALAQQLPQRKFYVGEPLQVPRSFDFRFARPATRQPRRLTSQMRCWRFPNCLRGIKCLTLQTQVFF